MNYADPFGLLAEDCDKKTGKGCSDEYRRLLTADQALDVQGDGRVAQAAIFVATTIQTAGAASAIQGFRLAKHLRQLERYGEAGYKVLQSGRVRYYGNLVKAEKRGEMIGRRLVREWDPVTDATRTWHEVLDAAGRVRQVRPQTLGEKAGRFRSWLQSAADRDYNAIIAYHTEVTREAGIVKAGRSTLSLFGVLGGGAVSGAIGAGFAGPVGGAIGGAVGTGATVLLDLASRINANWRPVVFGDWMRERIEKLVGKE